MSLQILHSWEVIKFESADQYQAHSCIGLLENKPQIKAPRVTPLEGVSTYAPQGIRVVWKSRTVRFRSENPQGLGIDESRLIQKSNHEFIYKYQTHSCMGLLENKPQINADERRFINSDEEACFLNRNLILSPHIFGMIYSSHNRCLL